LNEAAVAVTETEASGDGADEYAALREKVDEIYRLIEEAMVEKEVETRRADETVSYTTLAKLLERQAVAVTNNYAKSFLYSDVAATMVQYGA
jgi:phosphate uptake regulator